MELSLTLMGFDFDGIIVLSVRKPKREPEPSIWLKRLQLAIFAPICKLMLARPSISGPRGLEAFLRRTRLQLQNHGSSSIYWQWNVAVAGITGRYSFALGS